MKRILLSLASIGATGAIALAATGAFFSDTETSTGNKFQAGDIDLEIDNTSYAFDYNIPDFVNPTGQFIASNHTSWTLRDLTVEKFFDFVDLKPGDYGEDTISIHVGSNDAWVCAAANITDDSDQTCTEPELEDDATCQLPDGNGELDEDVQFALWVDDGDNVYEPVAGTGGSPETIFLSGPISGLNQQGVLTLADAQSSILGGTNPIPGGTTFYVGKIWCFGELTAVGLVQDGLNTGTPLTLGTGFTCDGTLVDNAAQTDQILGDLEFYAQQARNNSDFDCDEDFNPSWQPI